MSDIFSALAIDLGAEAGKLVKMCGSSVISQDETIQTAGRKAILALAKRCDSQSAANTIISYLLAVLGGSEGKLSTVAQKLSVVSTIRQVKDFLAIDTAVDSSLVSAVIVGMGPILKSEVSEQVILEILATIAV